MYYNAKLPTSFDNWLKMKEFPCCFSLLYKMSHRLRMLEKQNYLIDCKQMQLDIFAVVHVFFFSILYC